MVKKSVMISVMSALIAGQVMAADDVYVDLSVLDTIPKDSIGFVGSEPLFPVVKKQPLVKKKRVVRKAIQKQAPVPAVKPQREAVIPESPLISKEEEPKPIAVIEAPVLNDAQPEIIPEQPEYKAEEIIAGPQPIVPEPAEASSQIGEMANQVEDKQSSPEILPEMSAPTPNPEATANQPEDNVMSASISQKTEEQAAFMPREVYSLRFETDSSELTADQLVYLDNVRAQLDPSQKKKISIKAYNYDNGEDSFRKKRVSLVRATEVRSYFLNHGFKNFSIKIINTTADSEDKNTVEIEELN